MITRENYQCYLVDYADGKLDAVTVSELLLFLEQRADLKAEADIFLAGVVIPASGEESGIRGKLHKPAYGQVHEELVMLAVGAMENDLSEQEWIGFERNRLLYPELEQEISLLEKTRLPTDPGVVFPRKRDLKKITVPVVMFALMRVAAVLVLLSGISFVFFNLFTKPGNEKVTSRINMPAPPTAKTPTATDHSAYRLRDERKETKAFASVTAHVSRNEGRTEAISDEIVDTRSPKIIEPVLAVADVPSLPQVAAVNITMPVENAVAIEEPPFRTLPELAAERLVGNKDGALRVKDKPAGLAAQFLVRLYNKVTGDDARLVQKFDTSGTMIGYDLIATNFQFGRGK